MTRWGALLFQASRNQQAFTFRFKSRWMRAKLKVWICVGVPKYNKLIGIRHERHLSKVFVANTHRPQLKTGLQSPHSDKKQTIRRKEMTHCFVSKWQYKSHQRLPRLMRSLPTPTTSWSLKQSSLVIDRYRFFFITDTNDLHVYVTDKQNRYLFTVIK